MRARRGEPFASAVFFGKAPALAYYYATLPTLLYSRYLDRVAHEGTYELEGVSGIAFPWRIPELVAMDGPLVERVRRGDFNPWMPYLDAEIEEWLDKVLTAHNKPRPKE